ncbi:hypothetical protein P7C70_g9222, partial [Phenoliferia sp. Uapishka_3]
MTRDEKGHITSTNENDTTGAAELMLFLAASPSPAQVRSNNSGLAPGEVMKGRRLFAGGADDGGVSMSESARNVFGGPMMQNGSNGGGPFVGSPGPPGVPNFTEYGTSSGGGTGAAAAFQDELDPSSASSNSSFLAPSASSSRTYSSYTAPTTNGGSSMGAPTTPSRDRNSGGGWETYLNVSPSPQRSSQPFSMPLTSLSPSTLPLARSQGAGW